MILDSVREHLQHRQECTQPEEKWDPTSTSRLNPHMEFWARTHTPYQLIEPDLCEEAMLVVWDVHHQVLVAVAILEDHIKRLS